MRAVPRITSQGLGPPDIRETGLSASCIGDPSEDRFVFELAVLVHDHQLMIPRFRAPETDAERAACVKQTASSRFQNLPHRRQVTREDIDELREWAGTQSPASVGEATGQALASAIQGDYKMEFSEAADLAREYHQASDNDEVLTRFLESWQARQHKEEARTLAEEISDEKQREQILKKLK